MNGLYSRHEGADQIVAPFFGTHVRTDINSSHASVAGVEPPRPCFCRRCTRCALSCPRGALCIWESAMQWRPSLSSCSCRGLDYVAAQGVHQCAQSHDESLPAPQVLLSQGRRGRGDGDLLRNTEHTCREPPRAASCFAAARRPMSASRSQTLIECRGGCDRLRHNLV